MIECKEKFRLRAYDPQLKVKLGIYEDTHDPKLGYNPWDMSLIHNNIHPHFIFKIETVFEDYSPDWIYVKLYNWVAQDDEEYMFDWANEMPF